MHRIKVGMLGCGNVGTAFWELVERTHAYTVERDGRSFEVHRVLVRDMEKPRPVPVVKEKLTEDPAEILEDPEIDVVVEVMGGLDPARSYVLEALRRGKHVITANKVVVAKAWNALHEAAAISGAQLEFEAAVGAAIPIIQNLRGALSAVPIRRILGIVNGTSNYILTRMGEGLSLAEALREAQRLGYAEPEASDDLDGWDAACKISILAALAFGGDARFEDVSVRGIRDLTQSEILAARGEGKEWKLIARAELADRNEPIMAVEPVALPKSDVLADVRGVENAIVVEAEPVGRWILRGPGAGPGPTATALLGDLRRIDVERAGRTAELTVQVPHKGERVWTSLPYAASEERSGASSGGR